MALGSCLVTQLSKLSMLSNELQDCVTYIGWQDDTVAPRNTHFTERFMWHVKVPAPKTWAFFYLSFYVTLVRLRLSGKPSLSCQGFWCALSQTIYWCWVQISSVSWLLGPGLSYLSINVQLSNCSPSETLSASRQGPTEAWYNMVHDKDTLQSSYFYLAASNVPMVLFGSQHLSFFHVSAVFRNPDLLVKPAHTGTALLKIPLQENSHLSDMSHNIYASSKPLIII